MQDCNKLQFFQHRFIVSSIDNRSSRLASVLYIRRLLKTCSDSILSLLLLTENPANERKEQQRGERKRESEAGRPSDVVCAHRMHLNNAKASR